MTRTFPAPATKTSPQEDGVSRIFIFWHQQHRERHSRSILFTFFKKASKSVDWCHGSSPLDTTLVAPTFKSSGWECWNKREGARYIYISSYIAPEVNQNVVVRNVPIQRRPPFDARCLKQLHSWAEVWNRFPGVRSLQKITTEKPWICPNKEGELAILETCRFFASGCLSGRRYS